MPADIAPAAVDAVLLLGPTACGKSALALRAAGQVPLEIVAVDSAQVYRGMDVGTAKPGREERARVPHHLLDLRDPSQPYSAADFVRDATQAIETIRAHGRLPLLVGGTMLYAKALREGLSRLPSADAGVRREISAEAQRLGWPALHARLARVDPVTAARLPPNDAQRIQRALEVYTISGTPLSQLQGASRAPKPVLRTLALLPHDRAELHRRIEARFDAMLAAGLLDEVRALMQRGDLDPELPSLRSVGYRQAWEHLARSTPRADFRAAAIAATRQLAKRQITWLRSMTDAVVIDPFADEVFARIVRALRATEHTR
ncbi:MAG TPA: tRNA (adenosine(37)-N6)-dimethylallyltransferase MiaA [Burkholderiaceae bacterium]|nr:tRNA (adenosine(37)-N6)-dimethylallyltransferase MiaA [Burkholderiaceae bacterium]